MLTFAWLGTSVIAPAILARHALRRGRAALSHHEFPAARRHLERAARHAPLRERAICLAAEVDLLDRRPADALYALNTLLLEQDQSAAPGAPARPRSARVRLLRGLAACMLGRAPAARRDLISIPNASVDDLLAAAQACILANDLAAAQQFLTQLSRHGVAGPLAARIQLCHSALYFRLHAWEKSLAALPLDDQCAPKDALVVTRIRILINRKIAEENIAAYIHSADNVEPDYHHNGSAAASSRELSSAT